MVSIKSLHNYFLDNKESVFQKDGTLLIADTESKIAKGLFDFSDSYYVNKVNDRFKAYYDKFTYNENTIEIYKEMEYLCRIHNIKYKFILPPVHQFAINKIKGNKDTEVFYSKMLMELDRLNNFYNLQEINSWSSNNNNWYDGWHYRPLLGDYIVNCIYKNRCN